MTRPESLLAVAKENNLNEGPSMNNDKQQAEREAAIAEEMAAYYGADAEYMDGSSVKWRLRALWDRAQEAALSHLSDEQKAHPIFAFLDGSAPIDGVWFGEKHPSRPGFYWWRAVLREALATPPAAAEAQAVPDGYVLAPHYRGYARLGTGQYVLNHTADAPAELVISIATDAEKAGRTVGDDRDNPDGHMLQPETMAVRLEFATVAGLDALEKQLRYLREVHFPTPTDSAVNAGAVPSNGETIYQFQPKDRAVWMDLPRHKYESRTPDQKWRVLYKHPKTPTDDEVNQALFEVDDFIARVNGDDRGSCHSVNVLRAALAHKADSTEAPEVSDTWIDALPFGEGMTAMKAAIRKGVAAMGGIDPKAQPLTDEQIDALDTFSIGWMAPRGPVSRRDFARAIEAAHGIASSTKEGGK